MNITEGDSMFRTFTTASTLFLSIVAAGVPTAAWAGPCKGLTDKEMDSCLDDYLEVVVSQIDALKLENTDLEAKLVDASLERDALENTVVALAAEVATLSSADTVSSSELGIALQDYATTSDLSGFATTGDLSDYARTADLDTSGWSDAATLVESWSAYLSVDAGSDSVVFSGANVYVQSGSGSTSGTVDGTGNLIVGYDEGNGAKSGSHNLVVGAQNAYSSYGGIVGGYSNTVSSPYASVVGGRGNEAGSSYAAVLGGQNGIAQGTYATVTGGYSNISAGTYSVAVGGYDNAVYESDSVVVGGTYNTVEDGNSGYSNVLVGGFQATLEGGLFYSVMSYGNNESMTSSGYMD